MALVVKRWRLPLAVVQRSTAALCRAPRITGSGNGYGRGSGSGSGKGMRMAGANHRLAVASFGTLGRAILPAATTIASALSVGRILMPRATLSTSVRRRPPSAEDDDGLYDREPSADADADAAAATAANDDFSASAKSGGGGVYVSEHYSLPPGEVVSYLRRKGLKFEVVDGEKVSVEECPLCRKPTGGKRDNMHKLFIWVTNGAFYCHRCGKKGSWFALHREMDAAAGLSPPIIERAGRRSTETDKPPPIPDQSVCQRYEKNLSSHAMAMAYLTNARGLKPEVLAKYRVGVTDQTFRNANGEFESQPTLTFPWIRLVPSGTESVTTVIERVKMRSLKDKAYQLMVPKGGAMGWFGLHTVPLSADKIIITEGEFDAMAAYQGTGVPAISLPNGAKHLPSELIEELERFKTIYLWMDDDVAGQDGAALFARKLGLKRTVIVHSSPDYRAKSNAAAGAAPRKALPKDANDALREGLDMKALLDAAKPPPHDQITTFAELRPLVHASVLEPNAARGVQSRTFLGLNQILKGHRRGELTVLTGPTGVGKTTILSQISLGVRTLWGSFEIKNTVLAQTMLSQFASTDLVAQPQLFDQWADKFEELPLYFLRFFGSTTVEQVRDAMEFAVYAHDVEHIILDNLQFMLSGQSSSSKAYDKFELQDKAIEIFRQFATRHNVHITLVIHPRKEADGHRLGLSSVFGGVKATQEADNVVIIQRGEEDDDGNEYKPRFLDVKKNRFDGTTGTIRFTFDKNLRRALEIPDSEMRRMADARRGSADASANASSTPATSTAARSKLRGVSSYHAGEQRAKQIRKQVKTISTVQPLTEIDLPANDSPAAALPSTSAPAPAPPKKSVTAPAAEPPKPKASAAATAKETVATPKAAALATSAGSLLAAVRSKPTKQKSK